ncbi:hypothetical protein RGQ15_18800 [Paracoccus sp. MBLB3053]|uniref:Uncharacterized protein n=1 Tax=Paracoccus aurantius TaxID=3073814 RepID=A0ABU2HX37_9RHOB|nr:hypothetical protein [Paracoccus sp. MBLB3053]MDS9469619.1 hypothetical protein [Paracoccus sp. MBLB3053]
MTNTYLAAARDLVIKGMCESQVVLSAELEFHLASTLAHYIDHPIMPDRLTLRLLEMVQRRARQNETRELGDECLISCAFFASRLTRHGGTIVHYAGLGQNAYEIAGMPDVAHGFPDMLDVLQASSPVISEQPLRDEDEPQEERAVLILGRGLRY